jgi:tetratricopeptide (TPR) repeat protein
VLGDEHPDTAQPLEGLGLALTALGRLDEAKATLDQVIAIYRRHPGHDDRLASALTNLAPIEVELGHLDAARALGEQALAVQVQISGEDSVELAWPLALLAEVELIAGQLDRAWELASRAEALRVRFAVAPQQLAESHFVLAKIAHRRGQRGAARGLARRALAELGAARPELRATIVAWLAEPG